MTDTPESPTMNRSFGIAANATLILISRVSQALGQVVVVTVLLRRLGLAQFGTLGYLLALVGMTRQAGELGQDLGLSRGHMRKVLHSTEIISAAVLSRISVAIVLSGPLLAIVLLTAPADARTFLVLQLDVLLCLVAGALFSDYRAREEVRPESLAVPFASLTVALSTWLFVDSVATFAFCSLGGSTVLFALAIMNPWTPLPRPSLPSWSATKRVLSDSLSVAVCNGLGFAYSRAGLLALYVLGGAEASGAYSAGLRILQAAGMIPGSLALAIFPRLSRLLVDESPDYSKLAQRAFDVMLTVCIPAMAAFHIVVPDLLILILGDRAAPIIPVARIMSGCVGASFPGTILGVLMLSGETVKSYIRFWVGSIAFHSTIVVIAVTKGAESVGASAALVISDLVVTTILFCIVRTERVRLVVWPGLLWGAIWGTGTVLILMTLAPLGPSLRWTGAAAVAVLLGSTLKNKLETADKSVRPPQGM